MTRKALWGCVALLAGLTGLAGSKPVALSEFHCGVTFGFYAKAGLPWGPHGWNDRGLGPPEGQARLID